MEDRQITPDFKEDRLFEGKDISDMATDLLEATMDALSVIVMDFDSDISDYDKEALRHEILNIFKNRI